MAFAKDSGFSLPELLVSCVIVAVLSTYTLGTIRDNVESATKSASKDVLQSSAKRCTRAMWTGDQDDNPDISQASLKNVSFSQNGSCSEGNGAVTFTATTSPKFRKWTRPASITALPDGSLQFNW